jgi:hypothetical protein
MTQSTISMGINESSTTSLALNLACAPGKVLRVNSPAATNETALIIVVIYELRH